MALKAVVLDEAVELVEALVVEREPRSVLVSTKQLSSVHTARGASIS